MQNAKVYSEFVKRTQRHYQRQLQRILKEHEHQFQWGPEERIVDVGCGPGDVTASVILPWLPPDFQMLLGVDVSPSVIRHAITYNSNEKLTFTALDIGGDISDFIKKKDISPGFNKIFSFYTLHWLLNLERGVKNLFNLLRSGGQMLLIFPVDRLFQKTFKEVRSKDPWSEYSKDISRKIPPFPSRGDPSEEFKEMLIDAGFEVVKCEVQDLTSEFDCIGDLKDLIVSLDQDMDCIPIDLRPKYINDCFDVLKIMQVVKVSSSEVILTQSTLLAIARKP